MRSYLFEKLTYLALKLDTFSLRVQEKEYSLRAKLPKYGCFMTILFASHTNIPEVVLLKYLTSGHHHGPNTVGLSVASSRSAWRLRMTRSPLCWIWEFIHWTLSDPGAKLSNNLRRVFYKCESPSECKVIQLQTIIIAANVYFTLFPRYSYKHFPAISHYLCFQNKEAESQEVELPRITS